MGCGCGNTSGGGCGSKKKKLVSSRNRLRTLLAKTTDKDLRLKYSEVIIDMESLNNSEACPDSSIVNYLTNFVQNEYSKQNTRR